MSNEITVNFSLTVRKPNPLDNSKNLVNFNRQNGFQDDLTGNSGPYGGTILAGLMHTNIDLSVVTGGPGWAVFTNQSSANMVQIGLYDTTANKFLPFADLYPGKSFPIPLSANIGQEEVPGTGTSGIVNKTNLALKASVASVPVLVEIFPK